MVGRLAELRNEMRAVNRGEPVPRGRRSGDTPRESVRQRLDDHERLKLMEERGLIKLGTGMVPASFWTMPRPEDPEGEVVQALLDERESAR